jgi:hypothetical protein
MRLTKPSPIHLTLMFSESLPKRRRHAGDRQVATKDEREVSGSSGQNVRHLLARSKKRWHYRIADLSVLNDADASSCLLHVAIERGEDLFIFRRLLRPNRRIELNRALSDRRYPRTFRSSEIGVG